MSFPELAGFRTWEELLGYCVQHNGKGALYYQAPLDRYPTHIEVTKRFKNGKLRVSHLFGSFTADSGHLTRFRWRPETDSGHAQEYPE